MQSAQVKAPCDRAFSATILKILYESPVEMTVKQIENEFYEREDEDMSPNYFNVTIAKFVQRGLVINVGRTEDFDEHGNSCSYVLSRDGCKAVEMYQK